MNIFAAIGVMILALCQNVFAEKPNITLTIELLPNPDTVYIGDEAYFTCNISPTYMKNRYPVVWRYNYVGSRNPLNEGFLIENAGRILVLDHVSPLDKKFFRCQITIDDNETITSPPVQLKPKQLPPGVNRTEKTRPFVRLSNASQSINNIVEGDYVELICDIRPSSETIFRNRWFYNDDGFSDEINRSLIFKNIKKTSAGKYKCITESRRGFQYSEPIDLIVKDGSVKELRDSSKDTKESPELCTIPYAVYKYTIPNN